jgi:hypothetical protein
MIRWTLVVAWSLGACALAGAQEGPAATQGVATTAPVRRALVVPAGYKVIEVGDRRVVAEGGEEGWIRKAMAELAPATRPTTGPVDLVERLVAVRGELAREMVGDLGLADGAKVEAFLERMVREMGRYGEVRPPVFYLATTRKKLVGLVKSGWEDPRYYYNRAADEVMIDTGMRLSIEGEMDDMLLPALYLEDASPEVRAGVLQRMVQQTERMVADEVARRARVGLQVGLITFVIDEVFRPMGLKKGQDWFGVGASGVLSARYVARVSGAAEKELLDQMVAESPRVPVKAAGVDLIRPVEMGALREQVVPFYLDAVRRKSTAAVRAIEEQGGRGSIGKVIAGMRKDLPADGEGLVKLIERETGVDVRGKV